MLLRHPDELRRAAPSFNGKPILIRHQPTTAQNHAQDLVIGATGNNARYVHPYLQNSLVIWPQDAINNIEANFQKQLSSGYRYTADMTPGTYEGQRYDGVMRNIDGQHVALVRAGRAGADVIIGDSRDALDAAAAWAKLEAALAA